MSKKCEKCEGNGWLWHFYPAKYGQGEAKFKEECENCNGTGSTNKQLRLFQIENKQIYAYTKKDAKDIFEKRFWRKRS